MIETITIIAQLGKPEIQKYELKLPSTLAEMNRSTPGIFNMNCRGSGKPRALEGGEWGGGVEAPYFLNIFSSP